jgi:uncharacterized membrane protein
MSEEESGSDDESLRSVIEERMRERLPTLQSAIQSKTGKKISESELGEILSGEMSGVVAEISILASSAYSGPLPSPGIMRGYADLFGKAPEQLFEQFKSEQEHRHSCEKRALGASISDQKRRDFGALTMAFSGICLSMYLAYLGAHIVSALLVGALVLGGGALVLGRQFLASHGENGTQVAINSEEASKNVDAKKARSVNGMGKPRR